MLKLYSFSQSSASYRVRIALALKGLEYEVLGVNLIENAHQSEEYKKLNPQGRVPYLIDGENGLAQSLAIIEYLEEKYPNPSLFPKDIIARQKSRAFAHAIAADIFPLQNLSTRRKIGEDFGQSVDDQAKWSAFWIARGFTGLEKEMQNNPPKTEFLFADYPTIADICLIPQWNNAIRYGVDLSQFPILESFDKKARNHIAFISTSPDTQK